MNIDPDKLHRYWKNKCSQEEKRLVEQWLQAGEPDDIYSVGDDLEESQLKNELSALLKLQIKDNQKATQQPILLKSILTAQKSWFWISGIAASLLLFASISVYIRSEVNTSETAMISISGFDEIKVHYGEEQQAAFDSDEINITGRQVALNHVKTPEDTKNEGFFSYTINKLPEEATRSLDFYLSPNSSIHGRLNRDTKKGFINVQGSLKMVSKAGENLQVDFVVENPSFKSRTKVTIEDRQVYHVGILKEANLPAEILVLSSEELQDIPPRIKIMAFNDYTI